MNSSSECAICLSKCTHPVKLPCNHIFCFLCIKGASAQNRRCPMCRQAITDTYFDEPQLIEEIKEEEIPIYEDGYQWFYEGRNGWWLYDKSSSDEIETAFKAKLPKCEVLIAGFMYVIDFEKMLQYRRSEPQRQRRIKRDYRDERSTKGIAGLRRPVNVAEEACAPLPQPIVPQNEVLIGAEAPEPMVSGRSRSRSRSLQTVETQTRRRSRSNHSVEAEVERDLIARLENATLQHDRYRETYL